MRISPKFIAFLLGILGCHSLVRADTPMGDSGVDTDITFPSSLLYQNGGPIIDIKHPPDPKMHSAVGDGMTDDTAAFLDAYDLLKERYYALGGWTHIEPNFYIYIPNGTYLVSEPIIYRGAMMTGKPNQEDITRVRFIGQSRAKTILRLADHALAFQDAAHPRALLNYQHPDTKFNNAATSNQLHNITIDTGKNNPGVAAVMFQAANQSDIRNVTLRSGDGGGVYGLWFKIGSVQGYYTDITIEGFADGVHDDVNAEGDPAIEHLTLKGQRLAGIRLSGGGISLRKLLSDQSAHGVSALRLEGAGPLAVLVDSVLKGGSSSQPAVSLAKDNLEGLFARNVSTAGYGSAVQRGGVVAASGPDVNEYVTTPARTLFEGTPSESLNLPVQETPAVLWYDPARDWAVVDDYPSVQKAMDSGKPVVCFKQRHYKLPGDVTVPASVKRVNFFGGSLEGGNMVVNQPSSDPVLLQEGGVPVKVVAQRNVIERMMGGAISNPNNLPVTFFLENVNDVTSGPQFCPAAATVYARSIDVEYRNVPQIVCNGGKLWVFGFKTENKGTSAPFIVRNGGSLEVLNGYVNMLGGLAKPENGQRPIVDNEDSSASVTCFTNMTGLFVTSVQETQRGDVRKTANTDFPLRGGGYRLNYIIPLYVGRKAN